MSDIVDYLRKRLIVMLVTTLHYGGRTWNWRFGHWER